MTLTEGTEAARYAADMARTAADLRIACMAAEHSAFGSAFWQDTVDHARFCEQEARRVATALRLG